MPPCPGYDEVLIHPGRYFTAEWYYAADGSSPAHDYYDALPEADQDRFDDMIRYLCETRPGTLLPKTFYRIEDHAHKIHALKPRSAVGRTI